MSSTLLDAPASVVASSTPKTGPHLSYDETEFRECFHKQPFLIQHSLCDHPLFELERLLQLARDLPENHIEYNAGNLPLTVEQALTPRNGLSVEETIRRIESCKSWMVLKWVHHDPAYARLLEECLEQIRPLTEPICPGMRFAQAYIFLTSPGSVTPYHIDPEHNFLLQIRGSKTIHQFNGSDPDVLSPVDLERFYAGRVRNLEFREEFRQKSWVYNLEPGQGLHFPVTYPHYVQNGDGISVSFSITFRTPDLDKRRMVHQFNAGLRRWGVTPRPIFQSPLRDLFKYQAVRVGTKLSNLVRRNED